MPFMPAICKIKHSDATVDALRQQICAKYFELQCQYELCDRLQGLREITRACYWDCMDGYNMKDVESSAKLALDAIDMFLDLKDEWDDLIAKHCALCVLGGRANPIIVDDE